MAKADACSAESWIAIAVAATSAAIPAQSAEKSDSGAKGRERLESVTASHGAACNALIRAGRRGSVRIRGVTRRGALGSGTGGRASSLNPGRCDRHRPIIQHGCAPDRAVRRLMSPPGDGTMVAEIRSLRRSDTAMTHLSTRPGGRNP